MKSVERKQSKQCEEVSSVKGGREVICCQKHTHKNTRNHTRSFTRTHCSTIYIHQWQLKIL